MMGRLLVTKTHALVATGVYALKMVFLVGRSLLSNLCSNTRRQIHTGKKGKKIS